MKYLIKFSYNGSKFNGFQRLKNNNSVQRKIEEALTIINKSPVKIKGAGRTDAKVHAYNQAAHFNLDVLVPPERLINAINSLVGDYIHINYCRYVEPDFHARFNVKRKIYTYKIYTGQYNPLLFDYYEFVDKHLDLKLMKKFIKNYKGIHNFKNFVSGERDNFEAIIYNTNIKVNGDYIEITFEGKSFYRYMVRNLVGALLDIGLHKKNVEYVLNALNNSEEYTQISTANPKGLYLIDVIY